MVRLLFTGKLLLNILLLRKYKVRSNPWLLYVIVPAEAGMQVYFRGDCMNKREIGSYTEEKAADFLKQKGYRILKKNYRCKAGEIDLVAADGSYLVFVEVKYRKNAASGTPQEAVTFHKQRKISKAASWYLTENGFDLYTPCRFDVIAMEGEQILHIKDAFSFV